MTITERGLHVADLVHAELKRGPVREAVRPHFGRSIQEYCQAAEKIR